MTIVLPLSAWLVSTFEVGLIMAPLQLEVWHAKVPQTVATYQRRSLG
jgi:hypothetical protein